jgi:putative Ca2+/H+ antiporter (TMEM165/GDT1 family)
MENTEKFSFKQNILPLIFAFIVFLCLSGLLYLEVLGLNLLPFSTEKILTTINPADVIVGLLIYLKTSIDFALFIGILMKRYPGLKNRYAIEVGTALGNALGTMLVLGLWVAFKEINILLGLMVLLASLVLFEMAASSLEHLHETEEDPEDQVTVAPWQISIASFIKMLLSPILFFISPVLSKVMPSMSHNTSENDTRKTIFGLFLMSMSIPFILGLDDFAGYVPFFKVVNVFGFAIGVFLGHCILNVLLFINPRLTIKIIKNPVIAILGAIAFIILGGYGVYEAVRILSGQH